MSLDTPEANEPRQMRLAVRKHGPLSLFSTVCGPIQNNVYLLVDEASGEALLIDPAIGSEPLASFLKQRGWRLTGIVNTHGHFDHSYGDRYFQRETGAPLLLHPEDNGLVRNLPQQARLFGIDAEATTPDREVQDGETLQLGEQTLQLCHTPGHTPGGLCLVFAGAVLAGDTLFAGSIGRTDLPGGSFEEIVDSIQTRLFPLAPDTIVYPGHGPLTTIGFEQQNNPFVGAVARGGRWLP